MTRRKDGEGSVRQLQDSSWECLMQSKYLNENGRPKRIKRKANTEQGAIKSCKLALKAICFRLFSSFSLSLKYSSFFHVLSLQIVHNLLE